MPDTEQPITIVRRMCIVCGKPSQVEVPTEVFTRLNEGQYVQDAWPDGTPGQRETLITGTHETCYDDLATD